MNKKMTHSQIFWLDKFAGKAKGGLFIRNPLKEAIELCEKEGIKIVGIKYDGSYNIELIQEVTQ